MSYSYLVSVLIPCYNVENFVEQSVRSIMNQTYKNIEIIVINDCSTDSTASILKDLANEDKRIIYVENKINLKLPKTLNKAILLAKGEYIARMDADDISLPDRLEKQMKFMMDNPSVDIVGCNLQHIDEFGNLLQYKSFMPISHKKIVQKMALRSTLVHPSVLAKKSFFTDLGGFNEELSYGEDYELWVRGVIRHKIFANLSEILLYYRLHYNQMTSKSFNKKHAKIIRNFLWNAFKKTNNLNFLLGIVVQTRCLYVIISSTSRIRQGFKRI